MESQLFPFADSMAGVVLDGRGVVVGWTPAAEDLLGHRAEDVCGRPVWGLLRDPDIRPAPPPDRDSGASWYGEAVLRHASGSEQKVVFRVLPLSGDEKSDERDEGAEGEERDEGAGATDSGKARCLVLCAAATEVSHWRQDRALTRGLFRQDRVGLAVFDDRLRLMRTNIHFLPYTGVPPDLTGQALGGFLMPEDAAEIERNLRRVLETGRPLVRCEVLARTLDDPRGGVVMDLSAFGLQAPDGRVIGLTALFTDITELHRSRARLELLHRATAAVGGLLSVTGTGEELAAVLVPDLADTAVVEIAEAVFSGAEPAVEPDGRLLLRRTTATRDGLTVSGAVLAAREETTGPGAAAPPELTAPLRARGILLGHVTVRRAPHRGAYEAADLDLLREIAARASLALDNARSYTREHRAAVGLQRSLLPPSEAGNAAVTTAGAYLPADSSTGVGGDWFDVIPLSSARVALVAGDVVGHGLGASATMGRLRTAVRTLADLDLDPEELLVHLDDLVAELVVEDGEPEGAEWRPLAIGGTCVYAVYDAVSGRCAVASAGHPPPAVVDPDGRVTYVPVSPGPPLGVSGVPFEATEVELRPGSILALCTDGLLEEIGGDLDGGMAELARRLAGARAPDLPLREAVAEVVADLPAHELADDVTLLLARTRRVPAADTAVWSLEADPAAVAKVRELASGRLREWGLEELVFTTELVLSELVTNAIRYAGGPLQVRLILAECLTCEVSDPSATQPRMRRARLTDEGGRGLYLVAQLTTRWGSRYTRHGKTLWVEQDLPAGLADAPSPGRGRGRGRGRG
ncbi:SpoIIE family protein phosphatase [Streptomyces sp. NPDC003703]|uniref:SpoIIE family protein phosphatase n=1 Tax=Streptomyces sp. NPDC003283 TaxID=3364681 RepID=UPI0036905379